MKIFQILTIVSTLFVFSACQNMPSLSRNSGTILNIEIKTEDSNTENISQQAISILQNRLDALGLNGSVEKKSPNQLEVKIYGEQNLERAKSVLLSGSKLELMKIPDVFNPSPLKTHPSKESALQSLGGNLPPNRKILPLEDYDSAKMPAWVVVETPAIVDGSELRDAVAVSRSGKENDYQITFSLTPGGAQKFGDWTGKNIGSYLAVVLNDKIKSAPYIKSQIFDQGQIDGRFTKTSAEDLALVLRSGYLPATLILLDEKTFGK